MAVSEAEVVPKTEELGLGMPPAPSSFSPPHDFSVEALTGEIASLKLENKSADEADDQDNRGTGDREEIADDENGGVLEKDSGSGSGSGSSGKEKEGKRERFRYPQRPDEPDCAYYLKTGSCRFGSSCKFNHPARRERNKVKSKKPFEANQVVKEEQKEPLQTENKIEKKEKEDSSERVGQTEFVAAEEMQNGTLSERVEQIECKIEGSPSKKVDQTECKAAKEKGKEAISERGGQMECKYYSMPGGCKFGKDCKYVHRQGKVENNSVELNFLGLPIRPVSLLCPLIDHMKVYRCQDSMARYIEVDVWPYVLAFCAYPNLKLTVLTPPTEAGLQFQGERECPYYMRTGSCKFATNCKYHHPDPTAVGGQDPRSGHQNSEPPQLHGLAAQLSVTWPVQTMPNKPISFLDASPSYGPGMILPPQVFHSNPEWNGYQAPVNPLLPPNVHAWSSSAATINHKTNKGDIPICQQVPVDEYPERPGQPECQYFIKHGVCKFKMTCKFHHPKTRLQTVSSGVLSPVGLPLKPDQPVCTYYSRFGVCKYGPSCKFNHPIGHSSPASAGVVVSGQISNATT